LISNQKEDQHKNKKKQEASKSLDQKEVSTLESQKGGSSLYDF
jgi:hypothetical protein